MIKEGLESRVAFEGDVGISFDPADQSRGIVALTEDLPREKAEHELTPVRLTPGGYES